MLCLFIASTYALLFSSHMVFIHSSHIHPFYFHSHITFTLYKSKFLSALFIPPSDICSCEKSPCFQLSALRSALQSLHKACEVARCHNYYPGSLFLTWVSYYQSRVSSSQLCINEWNAMQDVESHRANSPVLFTDL